eukprot:gnl/TRDRNA2_/TRDRNA2_199743_c0_seq1.p1 gnl/TRDRNA2_/TRDRNA2_199743_c0~~gnl/TRDRNA2_/TRDRNA2_199743_c0_seq1.p1  ORF type:complete len:143 (+),score=29.43 gnl/TRDRNA2_/TRDRNA2_199743_c0_seq1:65-493(+)
MSDGRARMLAELKQGAGADSGADASHKRLLVRGCDPVMAERAKGFMPALLGNVQFTSCTDDDTFLPLLRGDIKYDVVCFAPGAMRWDEQRQPIPGGNAETKGWSLKEYRKEIQKAQGEQVPIVGSTDERQMVPMLRKALGLS